MIEFGVYGIAGYFSVAFFIFSAFYAYRVFQFNMGAKPWLAIYLGFIAMAFFSLLQASSDIQLIGNIGFETLRILSTVLLLLAGAMFTWGFLNMSRSFASFDALGKSSREKFSAFASGIASKKPVRKK